MSVFEFINSGFKHFIASFNVNSKEEFLENLKNNIMLNYPQMSEEKINGLIVSAVKNVVFLGNMADGETRVSSVCELKSEDCKIKIDDVFTFDFANFSFIKMKQTENKRKNKKSDIKTTRKVVLRRKKVQPEEVKEEVQPEEVKEEVQPEEVKEEVQPEEIKVEVQPEEVKVEVQSEEVKEEVQPKEVAEIIEPEIIPPVEEEQQPQVVADVVIEPEIVEEIPAQEEPVKVNKYKLLKEKIKHIREQN
jgi:hypothetical protein